MKIKTIDESVISHGKVNLPDVGTVEVPKDGIIEVADDLGQHLIDHSAGAWKKHHFQSTEKVTVTKTVAGNKATGKVSEKKAKIVAAPKGNLSGKPGVEDNDKPEDDENDEKAMEQANYRIELLKKDIDALRDIASALELPQDEYQELKKLALVNYILDKSKDEE